MFLISIDIEYRYNLIEQIKKYEKVKTDIFTSADIDNKEKFKEYNYVIIENNSKKIEYFANLGKNVIICCFDDEIVKTEYKEKANIFICHSKKEVVDFVLMEKAKSSFRDKKIYKVIKALVYILVFATFFALLFRKYYFCNQKSTKIINKKVVEKLDLQKENYVFLGDSITDFYDLERYYTGLPVVNSGVSGNQYHDLLDNLQDRVFKYNPTKVFILIGTNDIAFTDITDEELSDRIVEICDKIHEKRKYTEIYIESIYPVNKYVDRSAMYARSNKRIKNINKLVQEKIKNTEYKYIDMYSILKNAEGNLNVRYTYDGLHISHEGYKIITKEIKKIIYNN